MTEKDKEKWGRN